ncbi:MAG TPA: glycine cleavage system aminomethyltransferase GcvT, partial [bacterium]|nr:glycine cleavage system aminomethyltransferase GcvT [bacterium]
DFGGWEMPVQYSGILEEHRAVRERAGIFDVSHMGELEVTGGPGRAPEAHAQRRRQARRRAVPVLGVPDGSRDLRGRPLVYRRAADSFLLVVNASNTAKDFEWARTHASGDVRVSNASDAFALLAVQGPRAASLCARVSSSDPSDLPYYGFRMMEVLGVPALVSRTGYTGEDGFEIYLGPESAAKVFRGLLAAGGPAGVVPCGLGARDTLRLEARMALYGNDIDDTVTPWEADLGWIVKMKKGDFIGREALARQKEQGVPRKLAGFEMLDRGIARHGYAVQTRSGPGLVTSGTHSPTLGKPIGLALLPSAAAAVGEEFSVDIRGRMAKARVVVTPFYKRAKEVPA